MNSRLLVSAFLGAASIVGLASTAHAQSAWGNYTEAVGRIPGDIRMPVQYVPGYPAPSSALQFSIVDLPYWTSATKTIFGPNFPIFAYRMPGTEGSPFFAPSDYGVNCDNTLEKIAPMPTGTMGGGFHMTDPVYACKITNAPVVDMDWVRTNLDARGYTYAISYPFTNNGNSRAHVTWVKGCILNGVPFVYDDGSTHWTENMPAYCYRGMARLEGAPEGWVNQFTPWSGYTSWSMGGGFSNWKDLDYGPPGINPFGLEIASWPAQYRNSAVLHVTWTTGLVGSTRASQMAPRYNDWDAFQDDWLLGTPVPPPPPKIDFPPIPPYAGAGDPGAVNIGSVSDGVGTGASSSGAGANVSALPFDYAAFCNSPSKDGSPRSPLWTQNCLKKQP